VPETLRRKIRALLLGMHAAPWAGRCCNAPDSSASLRPRIAITIRSMAMKAAQVPLDLADRVKELFSGASGAFSDR